MRLIIFPVTILILFLSSAAYALTDDFDVYTLDDAEWIKRWDTRSMHWANIEVDDHNNLFILAAISENATCDDHNPASNFRSYGENDSLLAMIDSSGRTSWSINAGAPTPRRYSIVEIAPASRGVYVLGNEPSRLNSFNPSGGITQNIGMGRFVGHYDTSGNMTWMDDFSNTIWQTPTMILSDTSGSLYASMLEGGRYAVIPMFGGAHVNPQSQFAVAVRKYDINGNLIWENEYCDRQQFYQPSLEAVSDTEAMHLSGMTMEGDTFDLIAEPSSGLENFMFWDTEQEGYRDDGWTWISDDGYIYYCGRFYATSDFDPSPDEHLVTVNGQSDIYIIKMTLDGEIVDTASFGGQRSDHLGVLLPDGFGGFIGMGELDYTNENVTDPSRFAIFGISSDLEIEWAMKDVGGVRCLTVAPDGHFYMGGYSDTMYIARFNAQTFRVPFFSESTGF